MMIQIMMMMMINQQLYNNKYSMFNNKMKINMMLNNKQVKCNKNMQNLILLKHKK